MNSIEFQKLVKEEIRKLFAEGDGYPIQLNRTDAPVHPVDASQSDLMNLPGAPFGGRLYASQLTTISNEARECLKKWAKLCQMATKRYGEANAWPALVKQAALELGRQFETHMTQTTPNTGGDTGMVQM